MKFIQRTFYITTIALLSLLAYSCNSTSQEAKEHEHISENGKECTPNHTKAYCTKEGATPKCDSTNTKVCCSKTNEEKKHCSSDSTKSHCSKSNEKKNCKSENKKACSSKKDS